MTYHPPGSAIAMAWASLTLASSKPFSDISGCALILFFHVSRLKSGSDHGRKAVIRVARLRWQAQGGGQDCFRGKAEGGLGLGRTQHSTKTTSFSSKTCVGRHKQMTQNRRTKNTDTNNCYK